MDVLISKMNNGQVFRGLMIVNEKANSNYNIDFIKRMYTEEGRSHFTVRDNVLGHSQQGGIPSSFDRNMGTKLAAKTVTWLCDQLDHFASRDGRDNKITFYVFVINLFSQGTVHAETPASAAVLGVSQATFSFQPVQELAKSTDFEKRLVQCSYKLGMLLKMQIFRISVEQGWFDVMSGFEYYRSARNPKINTGR